MDPESKPKNWKSVNFARQLRANSTDAERKLWSHLRGRQMSGKKFRRQHPIGDFIVDFVCIEIGLVIELDGGQHLDSDSDKQRDSRLSEQGFRVLRFWNHEVLTDTQTVLSRIHLEIKRPHPDPFQQIQ